MPSRTSRASPKSEILHTWFSPTRMLRAAKSRWITWKFIYVYVRFKTSLAAQPYVKFVNFYGEYEQKRGRGAGELYSLFIFSLQLSNS